MVSRSPFYLRSAKSGLPQFRNNEHAQGVVVIFEPSPAIVSLAPLYKCIFECLSALNKPAIRHRTWGNRKIIGIELQRQRRACLSRVAMSLEHLSNRSASSTSSTNTDTTRHEEERYAFPSCTSRAQWMQLRLQKFVLSRRRINERSRGVVTLVKTRAQSYIKRTCVALCVRSYFDSTWRMHIRRWCVQPVGVGWCCCTRILKRRPV